MHDERPPSRNELWFARQLRDAARREQPQFSESLHQRVMQAIRPATTERAAADIVHAEPAPASESPKAIPSRRTYWRSASWRGAAWMTAAAAILVMAIAVRWFGGSQSHDGSPSQTLSAPSVVVQPGPIAKQPNGLMPSTPIKTSHDAGSNEVASIAGNYTLDDLTRDAQATAHLLVDQLPFETPADEWGL